MPVTKEFIAECSVLLWEYAKKTFPKGANNAPKEDETREAYLIRYRKLNTAYYLRELDNNDEVLIQKHFPQYRLLSRPALVEYVNNELPKQEAYRTDKIIFAKTLAEKYKSGVCGEIVRVLQDYAINNEDLKENSYAHIQIVSLKNRADIYHEILVIGLDDAGLQAFLSKNFDQCGDAVVLDYWGKDRYFVKQLPKKLENFYEKFKDNLAKGLEEGYSLYCWRYSQAVQPRVCEEREISVTSIIEEKPVEVVSLQQSASFFDFDKAIRTLDEYGEFADEKPSNPSLGCGKVS